MEAEAIYINGTLKNIIIYYKAAKNQKKKKTSIS